MDTAANISSGAPIEQATKTLTSLMIMRNELKRNGIEASSSPIDIATKWQKFSLDPKKKDAFVDSVRTLEDNNRFIGDLSLFGKSNVNAVNISGLAALKTFLFTRANDFFRSADKAVFTPIEKLVTGKPEEIEIRRQVLPAVYRTGSAYGIYLLAYAMYKQLAEDEGYDEEVAEKIAYNSATNSFGGQPLSIIRDLAEGILSSPSQAAAEVGIKALALVLAPMISAMTTKEDPERITVALVDLIKSGLTAFG